MGLVAPGTITAVGAAMRHGEGKTGPIGLEVRTEVKSGYLNVILSGEFQLEEVQRAGRRIFDFCYQSEKRKVLIDAWKVRGKPSLLTKIELSDSMVAKQMEYIVKGGHRLRVAHVVAEGMAEAPGFGETLAANRGAKVFVTTSLDEALRWLEVEEEFSS